MKIAYVLEDAGPSGGARVVMEHCTRLAARGHDVTLFTVTASKPRWFPSAGSLDHVIAGTYRTLIEMLSVYGGAKVATWWKTAPAVAQSKGRGFYLVQDIETSYVSDDEAYAEVIATYRLPLQKITESRWVAETLGDARYIGIGIDHRMFRRSGIERQANMVLYNYREHYLKDPDLFRKALRRLPKHLDVVTFGGDRPPRGLTDHRGFVSDAQVADLYNRASVYVSTSAHEGFCLPIVEAMACGAPVVTTNSDANMEFCIDGLNCLVVNRNPADLADAIVRLCEDQSLAAALSAEGLATAARYRWEPVIDNLEAVFSQTGGTT